MGWYVISEKLVKSRACMYLLPISSLLLIVLAPPAGAPGGRGLGRSPNTRTEWNTGADAPKFGPANESGIRYDFVCQQPF